MGAGPMSSPQRLSPRQSVALVWRTLRSMRTALILLLLIALASVAGSLLPQWPNTPERVLQYRVDAPVLGHVLRPRRAVRRVRVVVVRAAHDAAVRVARRVPRAAHPRALAGAAHPAAAGSRDRRLPALRRGARSRAAPEAAIEAARAGRCAVGGSGWRATRPARARRGEGRGARGREPRVPLGVHPAARRRRLRQGHRVQRARRGGRGPDLGRRRGELRRHDPGGPVLRRLHRASGCACATSAATSRAPGSRWTSSPSVDLLAPDGSLLRQRGDQGEPSREDRRHLDLPVELRVGAAHRGDARRRGRLVGARGHGS